MEIRKKNRSTKADAQRKSFTSSEVLSSNMNEQETHEEHSDYSD